MSAQDETSIILPAAFDVQLPSHLAAPGEQRARAAADHVRKNLQEALKRKGLHWGDAVFLRVFKEEGLLEIFVRDRTSGKFVRFRVYGIARQSGVLGPKQCEGDRQVPEGFYYADRAAMRPDSCYHLAINCGYPNQYDLAHQRTGSYIMIHGNRASCGCLAMSDSLMEEIYCLSDAALLSGQKKIGIHIFPFRMTTERMTLAKKEPWYDFWSNIKEGFDWFEKNQIPPDWGVEESRYIFH